MASVALDDKNMSFRDMEALIWLEFICQHRKVAVG